MPEDNGTVGISYAELTRTAESLRTLIRQLRASLGTTQTIINSSVGSDEVWNSDAARKYRNQFTSFTNTFDDFELALNKCATFLDETVVKAYEEADKKINQAASDGLTSRYDGATE